MKKIGLLGGSFDPPHRGHLFISNEAKKVLHLDEIWWLVTPQNPLKISKPATYEERLQNCKQITKNFPIKILEVEKKIKSQYSYQTIKFLIQYYKNIKFFWLMGADNLVNFHEWEKWQSIFHIISIVIFRRHGYNTNALKSVAAKKFIHHKYIAQDIEHVSKKTPAWTLIQNKEIRISSSEIRNQRNKLRGKY